MEKKKERERGREREEFRAVVEPEWPYKVCESVNKCMK